MTDQILKDLTNKLSRKIKLACLDFAELCQAADISPEDSMRSMGAEIGTILVGMTAKFSIEHPPGRFGEIMESAYRIALKNQEAREARKAQAS